MRRQKNYLITLIIIFILWLGLAGLIIFIEPEIVKDIFVHHSYLPFFLLLFLALFFTLSVIFDSSRRGSLLAGAACFYLFLRINGLGNILNFLLIVGVAFVLDQYFNKEHESHKS